MAQEAATKLVKFDGVEYTTLEDPYEDLDVLEASEDSKYSALAKALLGPDQYREFRKTHKKTTELLRLINVLLGGEDTTEDDAPTSE